MPPPELIALLQPEEAFDARPAIEWLVNYAAQLEASDLHLRPAPEGLEVLLRQDGVLSCRFRLSLEIYARLLVGLKNGSKLASYKNSTPQDGKWTLGDQEVRVAVAPTQFGEVAVLRLLKRAQGVRRLDELGFWPDEVETLQSMVDQPQGLVLATGPAGSGKTTTLLALMRWLQQRHQDRLGPTPGARLNVVTLEDPVEVVIAEFNQTSIQAGVGMTFATGLRSLLRQDPDLILVGEIRDPETASAVVQTSLTGHLVFSTVHARDSVGVVPRLLEMGCQPYQLAASLTGVVYQRLLRCLCQQCRRPQPASPDLIRELGDYQGQEWLPQGCPACQGTGYRGRAAVAELLVVDSSLREAILGHQRLPEPAQSLRQRALLRVTRGQTSYQEVCRQIPREPGRTHQPQGQV